MKLSDIAAAFILVIFAFLLVAAVVLEHDRRDALYKQCIADGNKAYLCEPINRMR